MLPHFFRAAIFQPATDEGIIALTEITRPGWSSPIRLTGHAATLLVEPFLQGVTHLGNDYAYAVVSLPLRPNDIPGTAPSFDVAFSTLTDDDLAQFVRSSVNDLLVSQKHVVLSDPDTIIEEFPVLSVKSAAASHASRTVMLTLSFDRRRNEPANQIGFTPDMFAALVQT